MLLSKMNNKKLEYNIIKILNEFNKIIFNKQNMTKNNSFNNNLKRKNIHNYNINKSYKKNIIKNGSKSKIKHL